MTPPAHTFSHRSASRFAVLRACRRRHPMPRNAAQPRDAAGPGNAGRIAVRGRQRAVPESRDMSDGGNPIQDGTRRHPAGTQAYKSLWCCGFSAGRVVSRDPRHCRHGCLHWRWAADVDGSFKQIRRAGAFRSASGIQRCAVVDWPWPLAPRSQLRIKPCPSPVAGSDVPT